MDAPCKDKIVVWDVGGHMRPKKTRVIVSWHPLAVLTGSHSHLRLVRFERGLGQKKKNSHIPFRSHILEVVSDPPPTRMSTFSFSAMVVLLGTCSQVGL